MPNRYFELHRLYVDIFATWSRGTCACTDIKKHILRSCPQLLFAWDLSTWEYGLGHIPSFLVNEGQATCLRAVPMGQGLLLATSLVGPYGLIPVKHDGELMIKLTSVYWPHLCLMLFNSMFD